MKAWLLEQFLPMWAKQTLLKDYRALKRRVRQLEQENEALCAYIRGVHRGMRKGGNT